MAAAGAFLVPTTITYAALQREGEAAGMPAELVVKVGQAVQQVRRQCRQCSSGEGWIWRMCVVQVCVSVCVSVRVYLGGG